MRPVPRPPSAPTRRPALGIALGILLCAAPASAAHAQFGKLVKRAAAAAADAAGGRAADAAAEKAGLPARGAGARDASALEITPERVDAFVAAMRGPLEGLRRQAANEAAQTAYEAARAEYTTRDDAYDGCKDRVTGGAPPNMASPALQRAVARFADGNVALSARREQATAAGNTALAEQLTDSINALALAVEEASFPALRGQCGRPPREPAKPAVTDDGSGPAYRAAVPPGMTPLQFGVLRERVGAWLVAKGEGGRLGAGELQVLEDRRAALEAVLPYYRTGGWRNPLDGLEPGR